MKFLLDWLTYIRLRNAIVGRFLEKTNIFGAVLKHTLLFFNLDHLYHLYLP